MDYEAAPPAHPSAPWPTAKPVTAAPAKAQTEFDAISSDVDEIRNMLLDMHARINEIIGAGADEEPAIRPKRVNGQIGDLADRVERIRHMAMVLNSRLHYI